MKTVTTESLMAAGACWATPANSSKVVDVDLGFAIAATIDTKVEAERAAVVAWLWKRADELYFLDGPVLEEMAERIERGEHREGK